MSLLSELILTARTYAGGGYPPFLYFGHELKGHLPVFCYHDISAEEFESHLLYVAENGYVTLNGDQLVERLVNERPSVQKSDSREIALTFDDGLAGFYTTVYPLLSKYRMKAIFYVIPAWIGRPGFVTWDQCREMHVSGWVDIQSHSYAHTSLVTSLKLIRIWRRSKGSPLPWGIPGFDPNSEDVQMSHLPVLEGASLFSGLPSLYIPDGFWQECARTHFEEENGDLERHYEFLLTKYRDSVLRIDRTKSREWMRHDLRRSREEIERAIPGHSIRHFAFPWHVNSVLGWDAVEAAGFVSAAVGLETTDKSRGFSGAVARIFRVNADFLLCLPGNSRSGFLRVMARKAQRRARGRNIYGITT
jgi:peptidoglycan/xylan/chitin deacetylase (PgdA/CDA1 family)